jgi:hypothetical protein
MSDGNKLTTLLMARFSSAGSAASMHRTSWRRCTGRKQIHLAVIFVYRLNEVHLLPGHFAVVGVGGVRSLDGVQVKAVYIFRGLEAKLRVVTPPA